MRSDGDASGRNEVVVVVLVLPVKVDLSRSFAHVDSFVIRYVYDNGAVLVACVRSMCISTAFEVCVCVVVGGGSQCGVCTHLHI